MLRQAQHERVLAWVAALTALSFALVLTPAAAQERALCTDRPGLGTPACTVEAGRVLVETGLADWTLDREGGDRSDTILFGDTLLRVGAGGRVELQLGWTPLGYSRERTAGAVTRATRTGDVTVGAKLNLASPDGSGFSAAVQAQATLPVGRRPIGAGDWGVRVVLPVSYDLSEHVQLQASPEVSATVDEDGDGRHTAYGGTIGVGFDLSEAIGAALEVQVVRDRDPTGHATQALAGLSLAWQASDDFQLDGGVNVALNRASDDLQLYAGFSRRF